MSLIEPQKVLHLKDELKKKKPNISGDYIKTVKKDGWWVCIDYYPNSGWRTLHSSAMREIQSMVEASRKYFREQLPKFHFPVRFILEAYIPDTPFHILNGVFNRSVGDCEAKDVHFYLHDMIPLNASSMDTALARFRTIETFLTSAKPKRIQRIPFLGISSDINDWQRTFEEVVAQDEEGIVLKKCSGLYYPGKRNSSLMKIKQECELDLLCQDIYWTEGDKGNPNMNLYLVRRNGTRIDVRVGKHKDIDLFELNPANVIGKVVQVRAMKELENGMLREPRFVCVRNDKSIQDID